MTVTFASEFAGIGGPDLGFERVGMECVHQSEIDPGKRFVLDANWPHVKRGVDIKHVAGVDIGRPTVMFGGFPCKNLSIGKGHRRGLDSDDSGLYYEFIRLAEEYQRLVDATNPELVLLENTPGLLSSNDGRDMAAVVVGLEELGYSWAYRVIDGRDIVLPGQRVPPQKRPRVIVAAHRDPAAAWAVLGNEHGAWKPTPVRTLGDLNEWAWDKAGSGGPRTPWLTGRAPMPTGLNMLTWQEIIEVDPDPDGNFWVTPAQTAYLIPRIQSGISKAGNHNRELVLALQGHRVADLALWRKSARPRGRLFDKHTGAPTGHYETWKRDGFFNTLTGNDSGQPTRQTHLIQQGGRLRTLTNLEWERLSAFPDDWTKSMSNGSRQLALGDCFQPTMAEALGQRVVDTLRGARP